MNGEINEKYTGNYDCALTVTDSNSVNDQVGALYDIILFALTITEEEKPPSMRQELITIIEIQQ